MEKLLQNFPQGRSYRRAVLSATVTMELSDDGGQYTQLMVSDERDGQELRVNQDEDGDGGADLESEAFSSPTLPSAAQSAAKARAACGYVFAVAGSRSRNEYMIVAFATLNVVTFALAVAALSLVNVSDDNHSSGTKCKADVTWGQPVHSFNGHSYQLVEAYKTGIFYPSALADATSRCYKGNRGYLATVGRYC